MINKRKEKSFLTATVSGGAEEMRRGGENVRLYVHTCIQT